MTIRIALLNDFELVVTGLTGLLAPFNDLEVVEAEVGTTALEQPVDIALFDSYDRAGFPWQELTDLLGQPTTQHVVVFTFAFDQDLVERALAMGVHGYLWKGMSASAIADALRRVAGGEVVVAHPERHPRVPATEYRWPFDDRGLTARESEVLALLAEGMPNARIAQCLFVSTETVRSHVKQVFRKLGVHTRSEATATALRSGMFSRR